MKTCNLALALALSVCLGSGAALAQQENTEQPDGGAVQAPGGAGNGDAQETERFELREAEEGLIRLDKRTGAMSFCNSTNGRLVCRLGADEREAYQQALSAMEERLKAAEDRIDALEAQSGSGSAPMGKKQDRLPRPQEELQADRAEPEEGQDAPGNDDEMAVEEREFDRALEFSQRAMRRFFEVIQDLRREMELEDEPAE